MWPWLAKLCHIISRIGQNHLFLGILCTYGIVRKEIIIHTVIYGTDIRFWPPLIIRHGNSPDVCHLLHSLHLFLNLTSTVLHEAGHIPSNY